ncbi:hypothetical protein HPB47_015399 [Ixodes persulcatus]|uniref:Uncharacterized protein n=1 Tax=Ixodes persulcatus TaxID=34615 RepID=A0AC60QUV0_IXOPE|nr:hypothetical protein HPB47_015399 [Ixodes persulcatus]
MEQLVTPFSKGTRFVAKIPTQNRFQLIDLDEEGQHEGQHRGRDTEHRAALEELLAVTVEQNIKVKTHLVRPKAQSTNIVRPHFSAATREEVKENIQAPVNIQGTQIFNRGHTISVHFDSPLPQRVSLYRIHLPVSAPTLWPKQCGNCGKLGHVRAACTTVNACTNCLEAHKKGTCPCADSPSCPNCAQRHDAFDRHCPAHVQARNVARKMGLSGGGWRAAMPRLAPRSAGKRQRATRPARARKRDLFSTSGRALRQESTAAEEDIMDDFLVMTIKEEGDILAYVGRFLVRSVMRTMNCNTCKGALTSDSNGEYSTLIRPKEYVRGSENLTYSSHAVIQFLTACEEQFKDLMSHKAGQGFIEQPRVEQDAEAAFTSVSGHKATVAKCTTYEPSEPIQSPIFRELKGFGSNAPIQTMNVVAQVQMTTALDVAAKRVEKATWDILERLDTCSTENRHCESIVMLMQEN